MSAAQSAAPTAIRLAGGEMAVKEDMLPVLVNENKIEAKGISSSRVATVPNLSHISHIVAAFSF